MSLETSRLQVTGVTGGPLRITGASLVNGAYELATAGGADYELQTERQTTMDNILFIPGIRALDPDAKTYINAVEFADGQPLESAVRTAIDKFVRGCKADGIWDAIKASCVLAGARTLDGALVPLKGSAPTNNGPFVSGDYDRKTGLAGNGTTKFLNSNRNNNADPQNSNHNACYVTLVGTQAMMGDATGAGAGRNNVAINALGTEAFFRSRTTTSTPRDVFPVGLFGISRSLAAGYLIRSGQETVTEVVTSTAPTVNHIHVFSFNNAGSPSFLGNHRIAFYSIGESLNLALLDARVTTLINTFGAVI